MTHDEAKLELRTIARSRDPEREHPKVMAHVADCDECKRLLEEERALDAALTSLPRPAASDALLAKLRRSSPAPAPRASPSRRAILPLLVAAALGLMAYDLGTRHADEPRADALTRLDDEAVNDHLRIVFRDQPDIASGGVHQVKPWFTGKLDFAPDVKFGGDDEFPLVGGSLAYFVDRKAAAFVFTRRLHVITLLVHRADGLPWDDQDTVPIAGTRARERSARGFHVLSWQKGGLRYELVSDVDPRDLKALAEKLLTAG